MQPDGKWGARYSHRRVQGPRKVAAPVNRMKLEAKHANSRTLEPSCVTVRDSLAAYATPVGLQEKKRELEISADANIALAQVRMREHLWQSVVMHSSVHSGCMALPLHP